MKPDPLGPSDIDGLRSALLAHYDRAARDLPWRRDRDPYRVLVSEIMLQQTRVETVLGYYDPWLERFPTAEALAEAEEDEVMKAWEGLGYYRRARNLHRAARAVRERDHFPSSVRGLRELPGVGEYTAGAVASIAFGVVTPAVDGNVRRVLSRLHDEPDPKPAWLRERATALVHPERPGDWNQALMELGATVCTPRNPSCSECPLEEWCAARAAGTQDERPAPPGRQEVPEATFALAVLEREGRVLVQRRPVDGLLGGLWAFPEARLGVSLSDSADDGDTDDEAAGRAILQATAMAERLGLEVASGARCLEPVPHRFSHLAATYLPVVLEVRSASLDRGCPSSASAVAGTASRPTRWIHPEDEETALPTAQRKVLEAWRPATTTEVS